MLHTEIKNFKTEYWNKNFIAASPARKTAFQKELHGSPALLKVHLLENWISVGNLPASSEVYLILQNHFPQKLTNKLTWNLNGTFQKLLFAHHINSSWIGLLLSLIETIKAEKFVEILRNPFLRKLMKNYRFLATFLLILVHPSSVEFKFQNALLVISVRI